jgi:hypothetical protein
MYMASLSRLLHIVALVLIATLLGLVALLAMSPPFAGLGAWDQFQPLLVLAPLRTYLFRNAVLNTLWLCLGVAPLALLLGWGWARLGIHASTRPLLLLPILFPSALLGLLWQPIVANWLDLAQAELSLALTGLVMLWRIVSLAAWLLALDRRAWRSVLALAALLILLDGAFVLTFNGGEPFNASHTWASWMLQQLWVNRAWGYAASMAGGLALVVALVTWFAPFRPESPLATPPRPILSFIIALGWIVGPFLVHLITFLDAPAEAVTALVTLGGFRWLLNGALLWMGATLLGACWALPMKAFRLSRWVRAITLALLPLITVAVAYLVEQWPFFGNRWVLVGVTSLLTTGLLMGDMPALCQPRQHWPKVAGYALLVMAHTFPLQLMLQLPTSAWTPALGMVWTLGDAPHLSAAKGFALLICGLVTWGGGWIAVVAPADLRRAVPRAEAEGELSAAG